MTKSTAGRSARTTLAFAAVVAIASCGDGPVLPIDGDDPDVPRFASCDLDVNLMIGASTRDGIPALDAPVWDRADASVPDYLDADSRVVGLVINGVAHAIPLNVLWHHEIVNLDSGGPNAPKVAITHCPLTGSSLVFDRASVNGATLGVSGILFMNNLLVFDRQDPDDTLWPQMLAEARCGTRRGAQLGRYPFVEMEWAGWVALHPGTLVLAGAADQGFNPVRFDYRESGYPYGMYRENDPFFNNQIMPEPLDRRRFVKERVIGVPSLMDEAGGDQGIAFPFGALTEQDGDFQVVEFVRETVPAVILWSDDAQGGSAFEPMTTDGDPVTLRPNDTGFQDDETGSQWSVDGRATSGPLQGARLMAIEEAHTAFWGAWWAFHQNTELWEGI